MWGKLSPSATRADPPGDHLPQGTWWRLLVSMQARPWTPPSGPGPTLCWEQTAGQRRPGRRVVAAGARFLPLLGAARPQASRPR